MRIRGGGIMGTWDRLGGVSWGRDDVGLISCAGGDSGAKGWGLGGVDWWIAGVGRDNGVT